jgi:thiopeptide-type bacteriocin biosynthesis protein
VERYGGSGLITAAEQVFSADSEAVLALAEIAEQHELETDWIFALPGIDRLFDDFGIGLSRRVAILRDLAGRFMAKLAVGQDFRQSLGAVFRQRREEVMHALDARHLPVVHEVFARRSEALKPLAVQFTGALEQSKLEGVIKSFIHMHINRVCRYQPNRQEIIIYDLLRCHYEMLRHRPARRGAC